MSITCNGRHKEHMIENKGDMPYQAMWLWEGKESNPSAIGNVGSLQFTLLPDMLMGIWVQNKTKK